MRFGIEEGVKTFLNVELLIKAVGTKDRTEILKHAFLHYLENFYNQDAFDTYVFCLSKHRKADTDGLLSMWRGYGLHGNGIILVFDPVEITEVGTSPLQIAPVSYATNIDRSLNLKDILDNWAKISEEANLTDDKIYLAAYAAFAVIRTYALVTKHIGFSEEQEWRVIYYPERDRGGLLKQFLGYHIGDRGVEPKLKYPLTHIEGVSAPDFSLDRILDCIILGPSVSSPLAKRSVERMLEKLGKGTLKSKLHASGIPLRPSGGSSF